MSVSRFKEWAAYRKSYTLANAIQKISTTFPKEERYSLTDQLRRSSRSICANLAEAYGKRVYPKHFSAKLTDAISENFETQVWIDFALEYKYMSTADHDDLKALSIEVGKLLSYMTQNVERFLPKPKH